jgi:hypothetical protein
MALNAPDPDMPSDAMEREVDEVTSALAADSLTPTKKSKTGQIEVRLTRIVELRTGGDPGWQREGGAGRVEDDADGSHTISVDPHSGKSIRVNTCQWRPWDENEEFYVKFVYHYMGIEKLVNLGLCTADGTAIAPLRYKGPDNALAGLPDTSASKVSPLKRLKAHHVESAQIEKMDLSDPSDSSEEEASSSDEDDFRAPKRRGLFSLSAPLDLPMRTKGMLGSTSSVGDNEQTLALKHESDQEKPVTSMAQPLKAVECKVDSDAPADLKLEDVSEDKYGTASVDAVEEAENSNSCMELVKASEGELEGFDEDWVEC